MRWICAALCLFALGATSVDQLVMNAKDASDYPNAGALVLRDEIRFTLDEGDRTVRERHLLVKIFDDRGIEEYGDLKQRYNSESEEFEILEARVYRPGAGWIEPEDKAISDLSAPEVFNASMYTQALMKVVSFPGLDRDAVIDYRYRITSKEKGEYFGDVIFQSTEPIREKTLILDLPRGKKIRYDGVNTFKDPEIFEEGDRMTYIWTFENVEKLVREPFSPVEAYLSPRIFFTWFQTWGDLGRWMWERFEKGIEYPKNVMNQARSLALQDREETLRSIYLYVMTEIRDVPLTLGSAGYAPNPAGQVLRNGFGDGKDKAVLLISLLRTVGIDAYPCFVNAQGLTVQKTVPSPAQFDQVLVVAVLDGGFVFLDPQLSSWVRGRPASSYFMNPGSEVPIESFLSPMYRGREGFVIREGDQFFEDIPGGSPEGDRSLSVFQLVLDSGGGLRGTLKSSLSGFYARSARLSLKDKTQKEQEIYFQEAANALQNGARLVSSSLSDLTDWDRPVHGTLEFEIDGYAGVQGDLMRLHLPESPLDFSLLDRYVTLAERDQPIMVWQERSLVQDYTLKLPEGYGIQYLPEDTVLKSEVAMCEVSCTQEEGIVHCIKTFTFRTPTVHEDRYLDLKRVYELFVGKRSSEIVLKRS
jgi:transglutaminase-like putative cysteine protease